MQGIGARLADTPHGRLARAHAADRAALPLLAAQLDDRAETLDRPRAQFERGLLGDEFSPLLVVRIVKESRHRDFDETGIAVYFLPLSIAVPLHLAQHLHHPATPALPASTLAAL